MCDKSFLMVDEITVVWHKFTRSSLTEQLVSEADEELTASDGSGSLEVLQNLDDQHIQTADRLHLQENNCLIIRKTIHLP